MKKVIAQLKSDPKSKLILLILLFLIATTLWAKILLFNNSTGEVKEKKKAKSNNVSNSTNEKISATKVNLEKIYGTQIKKNSNPFIDQFQAAAKFTYQSQSDDKPLELKKVDDNLKLQGIINDKAIINYQGQVFVAQVGAEVGGYKVLSIRGNKVIYSKAGKKYFSTLAVKIK
ncbi:hypothetical protein [Halanaerobacter jeridensis]|uniref:Uncharacterized protein n=1 Tax=Halanaerobacter jeridensis TaxID=706427 RepID=A0A938XMY8_9FIRM|nr:hypothetical protein [Halanaerobacter jeridensis]MBM7555208.1 hypothetical protein [Halanaerobacter jeridensis]